MILHRRRFLACLTGIIAAPAVVKAESLMRVVVAPPNNFSGLARMLNPPNLKWLTVDQTAYVFRTRLPSVAWRTIAGKPDFWRNKMYDDVRLLTAPATDHG